VCITLTDENFAEVLQEREPVVVVFSVEWCGSCHMMAPVIEELASDYEGQVKVGKVDIDHNPRIGAQYGIRSTPSLLFFRNGQLVDHVVGMVPKQVLRRKLHSLLQKTEAKKITWRSGLGFGRGAIEKGGKQDAGTEPRQDY
jgi:thioredoxin 1